VARKGPARQPNQGAPFLKDVEIHTGYIARRFPEQEHISNFDKLDSIQRRASVEAERRASLIKAAALKSGDRLKSLKKLYAKTSDYIHLQFAERLQLLRELADEIGTWKDARLFAEAVNKATVAPGADCQSAIQPTTSRRYRGGEKFEIRLILLILSKNGLSYLAVREGRRSIFGIVLCLGRFGESEGRHFQADASLRDACRASPYLPGHGGVRRCAQQLVLLR